MKIMKYMMQVLLAGGLLTSCIEDADVTAYLTEDQLKILIRLFQLLWQVCILICNSMLTSI